MTEGRFQVQDNEACYDIDAACSQLRFSSNLLSDLLLRAYRLHLRG